jgi:hypothetical protein
MEVAAGAVRVAVPVLSESQPASEQTITNARMVLECVIDIRVGNSPGRSTL